MNEATATHGLADWLQLFLYAGAGIGFILALKWLTHPTTARRGILAGEIGMVAAVVGTLITGEIEQWIWIIVAMLLGSAVGTMIGLWVPMTAMPQRIAFSHAFGALAAALVGTAEYLLGKADLAPFVLAVLGVEMLLGYLTFTGSLMAFGKLQGWLPDRPWVYTGQNLVNFAILLIGFSCVVMLVIDPANTMYLWPIIAIGLLYGVFFILRIGGADMPTVISLMNSFAGLSGAALGFAIDNPILIIAGALDGSSGFILSVFMSRAMNRSFTNVLFGAFGQEKSTAATGEHGPVRETSTEEVAMLLDTASLVIVIPGYGMAAAQAQHKVAELTDMLAKGGTEVLFAIHPVAGRMPGHMNVLLAEADVPYDRMVELDDVNGDFPRCDVAIVIGANDVVNPAARHDKGSPIYGMPILDVDKAHNVVVVKRSMRSGFAGIENELFYQPGTAMLFGDAKEMAAELVHELGRIPGRARS